MKSVKQNSDAEMPHLERDIGTEDCKIQDLVKLLKEDKYLIPTFQRDFVWDPSSILKLWDSIYKFYPIGNILYWETDSYLHTHRKIGGFIFPHDEDTVRKFKDWKYILDGQQRATSLLVTMLGGKGKVSDDQEFDYTLYFDATDCSFFFAKDLPSRKKNVSDERLLVRLRDVPSWGFAFYKEISSAEGFNKTIEQNLIQLQRIFSDYKIPVVRIKGVEVNEVCEIFERINQEGKKLDPVDIIVARTYRNEDPKKKQKGFYLRDNLNAIRTTLAQRGNRFQDIEELTLIQMFAICLRKTDTASRSSYGITPAALDNLDTADFEEHWDEASKSILNTIKFLSDTRIHGPAMLPFVYLALPVCYYLHKNKNTDAHIVRQWFWRNAFGLEEFRSSTDVYRYCEDFFKPLEKGKQNAIEPLTVSKQQLVEASYNSRNSLSRAVLSFLAAQNPLDFKDSKAVVLDNVYLLLTQAPNLHHIYPQNFLEEITLPAGADKHSLMNICFIRALTNIQISDKNPLKYFKDFKKVHDFDKILASHLIPAEFIDRSSFKPADYKDFLFERAGLFARKLQEDLPDVKVKITD